MYMYLCLPSVLTSSCRSVSWQVDVCSLLQSVTLVFAKPAILLLDHRLSAELAKAVVTPSEGDPRIRQQKTVPQLPGFLEDVRAW